MQYRELIVLPKIATSSFLTWYVRESGVCEFRNRRKEALPGNERGGRQQLRGGEEIPWPAAERRLRKEGFKEKPPSFNMFKFLLSLLLHSSFFACWKQFPASPNDIALEEPKNNFCY